MDECHAADHVYLEKYRAEYGRAAMERDRYAALLDTAKGAVAAIERFTAIAGYVSPELRGAGIALRAAVEAIEGSAGGVTRKRVKEE